LESSATIHRMKLAIIASALFLSSVGSANVPQPLCGADDGRHAEANDAPSVFDSAQKVGTKASCPISGESFTISAATAHSEYKGKHVYFCCPGCKTQFDKNPDKFLARKS
jgi:YHS domain-containing protein